MGDVIGISFESMAQAKIKLNRARDLSQQVMNNFNAAITALDNGTSLRVRLAAADIREEVNKVSKRIEDIDRVNVGIDYAVRRFQEVDDNIASKIKGTVEEYRIQNNQLTLGESTVNVSALGGFQLLNNTNLLEMNDYEKLQGKVIENDSANNWLSNEASYAWGGIKSGTDAVVSFTGTTVGETFNNFIYKPIYAVGKAGGYIQNKLTGSNDINNSNEYFKKNNIDVTVDWFDSLGSNKKAKEYGNITGTGAGQILQMISLGLGGKAVGIASKAPTLVQNGILNFGSGAISTALNEGAEGKSARKIVNNSAKMGLMTSLTGVGFDSLPYVNKGLSNIVSRFNNMGLKPAFATNYTSSVDEFKNFVGPFKKPSIYGGTGAANIEIASIDKSITTAGKKVETSIGSVGEDFVGRLRGKEVKLEGVKTKEIEYVKRDTVDLQKLRNEFDSSTRKELLKDLSKDTDNLKKAGFSTKDIIKLQKGRVPDGWQVHHKLPLDDSGINTFDNMILIRNEPYHKVITNFQNSFAKQLTTGEVRTVNWPIPEGSIYPPKH